MLLIRELKGGKPFRVRNVRLVGTHINFGRSPACTYQLENIGTVSRVQATLKCDSDGWWLSDGGLDKPSAAGCYVGSNRLYQPIPIEPGLKIQIFKGSDYEVCLEVISEISEQELIAHDEPTLEVPLFQVSDEIAQMRESINLLAQQVQNQALWIKEHETNCQGRLENALSGVVDTIKGEFRAAIAAEVSQLRSDLHPKITEVQTRNDEQDVLIKRVLGGLAAALIAVSGYNLSQGDSDSIRRALDVFSMVLGVGGAGAIVVKNANDKGGRDASLPT